VRLAFHPFFERREYETKDYQADQRLLTPENLKKLEAPGAADSKNDNTASTLRSRALQYVFFRRFEEAMKELICGPKATAGE
jgi:hypothetical protein